MADKFSKYAAKEDKFSKYRAPEHMQAREKEPEEEQGFSGVYSDAKRLAQNAPAALFGAAINAPSSIMQATGQALSLPYENLKFLYKTAKEGFKPENTPRLTANLMTGLHKALNVPSEIANYAGRKGFIPKNSGDYIHGDFPDVGLKPEDENAILQSIPSFGSSIAKKLPGILEKAGDIAPIVKSIPSKTYKQRDAYLSKHGIEEGVKVDPKYIKEAYNALTSKGIDLPKEVVKNAFTKANQGNFKGLFAIQSTLKSEARKLAIEGGVHTDYANKLHVLAEKIHEGIKSHYKDIGHEKAAELMDRSKARNARYHKISPVAKVATGLASAAALPNWIDKLLRTASK